VKGYEPQSNGEKLRIEEGRGKMAGSREREKPQMDTDRTEARGVGRERVSTGVRTIV
jgi:hypothetical protein